MLRRLFFSVINAELDYPRYKRGQVMGVYKANKSLAVVEDEVITEVEYQTRVKFRYNGKKQYELSNHLGNVLVTISDRRKAICNEADSTLRYEAVVITASDYYSFGSPLIGRTYQTETSVKYRYSFNGQEKDDEVNEKGNSYSFEYRFLDSRLGRFLSLDPLVKEYPWNSPFSFAENRVGMGKEMEGLEIFFGFTELMMFENSSAVTYRPLLTPKGRPVELIENNFQNGNAVPKFNPARTGTENWVDMCNAGRAGHNLIRQTPRWKEAFGKEMGKQFPKGSNGKSSNLKPDGFSRNGSEIKIGEGKSGTQTGIRRGLQQLDKYYDMAKDLYPEATKIGLELHTYRTVTPIEMTHTVSSGESPWSISQKYGLSLDNFYKLNNMKKGDMIHPNQAVVVDLNFMVTGKFVPLNFKYQQDVLTHKTNLTKPLSPRKK